MTAGVIGAADTVGLTRAPELASVGRVRRAFGSDALSAQLLTFGYCGAIISGDALIANKDYLIGASVIAATLIALILQGAAASSRARSSLFWALALVPMSRLVSLVLPLADVPFIYWYWIVGLIVGLGAVLAARAIEATPGYLGLRIRWRWAALDLLGLPLGLSLGLVAYAMLRPPGWLQSLEPEAVWFPAITVTFAGFVDEFMYRGILLAVATTALGLPGLLWVTALGTTASWGAPDLFIALVGVVNLLLCLIRLRTGSLLGPFLAHGGLNAGLYIVGPAFASELYPYIVTVLGCQPLLEGFC